MHVLRVHTVQYNITERSLNEKHVGTHKLLYNVGGHKYNRHYDML